MRKEIPTEDYMTIVKLLYDLRKRKVKEAMAEAMKVDLVRQWYSKNTLYCMIVALRNYVQFGKRGKNIAKKLFDCLDVIMQMNGITPPKYIERMTPEEIEESQAKREDEKKLNSMETDKEKLQKNIEGMGKMLDELREAWDAYHKKAERLEEEIKEKFNEDIRKLHTEYASLQKAFSAREADIIEDMDKLYSSLVDYEVQKYRVNKDN